MKTKIIGAVFCATFAVAMSSTARADIDTQPSPHSRGDMNAFDTNRQTGNTVAKGPHMSTPVSKALKAVFDAAKKKDWAAAKTSLAEAQALTSLTDFDAFEIDVAAGYVALNTGDHPGTLVLYKKVIANPLFTTALSVPEQVGTLRNAMILSNEAGDFTGAIALGQKLIGMGSLDESSAVALATAYFATKDYAHAQSLAQKTIDAEVSAGQKANETAAQIVLQSKAATH